MDNKYTWNRNVVSSLSSYFTTTTKVLNPEIENIVIHFDAMGYLILCKYYLFIYRLATTARMERRGADICQDFHLHLPCMGSRYGGGWRGGVCLYES